MVDVFSFCSQARKPCHTPQRAVLQWMPIGLGCEGSLAAAMEVSDTELQSLDFLFTTCVMLLILYNLVLHSFQSFFERFERLSQGWKYIYNIMHFYHGQVSRAETAVFLTTRRGWLVHDEYSLLWGLSKAKSHFTYMPRGLNFNMSDKNRIRNLVFEDWHHPAEVYGSSWWCLGCLALLCQLTKILHNYNMSLILKQLRIQYVPHCFWIVNYLFKLRPAMHGFNSRPYKAALRRTAFVAQGMRLLRFGTRCLEFKLFLKVRSISRLDNWS